MPPACGSRHNAGGAVPHSRSRASSSAAGGGRRARSARGSRPSPRRAKPDGSSLPARFARPRARRARRFDVESISQAPSNFERGAAGGIEEASMRVLRHLSRVAQPIPRVVLTLGNFDGVHVGHQAILRRAVEEAAARGARAVALTFEPHPIAVLAPDRAPPILQPLHDRLAMLRELGLDLCVVQRFTRAFAALTPEQFVEDFLLRHLEVMHVVVGYNVRFGRNRAGSVETLQTLGARRQPGVLNIGIRPTFAGARRTVEAHFLDFAGDLYRRWLVVEFIERLRGESAFAGPEALKAAIAADVARARRVLAAEPTPA